MHDGLPAAILLLLTVSAFTAALSLPPGSLGASASTGVGTISLSRSTGVPVWKSYYSDFGDRIVVTGTGFPSEQDDIQIVMVPSTTGVVASVSGGCTSGDVCDLGSLASEFDPSIAGSSRATVEADADGWFKVQVDTPVVGHGDYLLYAVYPKGSGRVATATAAFTVVPEVYVASVLTGSASSGPQTPLQLSGVGFGRGEQVRPSPSSFFVNSEHSVVTTGSTPGVDEGTFDAGPETTDGHSCVGLAGGPYCVGSLSRGSLTLTIVGASSGASGDQTYAITPQIAFWAAPGCTQPTYSVDTSTGSEVCVSGSGFFGSTRVAAASSVSIGGASTSHSEIDTDANGAFGPTVVTLTEPAGTGILDVGLGGSAFSYLSGNIYQPNQALSGLFPGALVGSHGAQGARLVFPEGDSRRVGERGVVIGYGYDSSLTYAGGNLGFVLNPSGVPFLQVAPANGGDATGTTAADANGVFMASFVVPTIQHFTYRVHDSTSTNGAQFSTFTVDPDVGLSADSTSAGAGGEVYLTHGAYGGFDSQRGLSALGVSSPPLGDLTVYVNGDPWGSCGGVRGLCDSNLGGTGRFIADVPLPALGLASSTDLPGGDYAVNVTGLYGGDWASGRHFVDNAVGAVSKLTVDPVALAGSLSPALGRVGTAFVLSTGPVGSPNPGVHGLKSGAGYTVTWDGKTQLGAFVSTVTGGVPPGTVFIVPASPVGLHIVDIQEVGGSALWGHVLDHDQSQYANMIFDVTTMSLTCKSQVIFLGSPTSCEASVDDTSSTGRVVWSKVGGTGSVSFSPVSCTLVSGACSFDMTGSSDGSVILNGTYTGDLTHARQSILMAVTVISFAMSCTPSRAVVGTISTCRATVYGNSPAGKVAWSTTGVGKFSLDSCEVSGGGCDAFYTSTSVGTASITASYSGDGKNPPSSASFGLETIAKASRTSLFCSPRSVLAGSSITVKCLAIVTGYLPSGQVGWTQSGKGSVTFGGAACKLANRRCTVALNGTKWGQVTVRATYQGDMNNVGSSAGSLLTVNGYKPRLLLACPTPAIVGVSRTCSATLTGYTGSVKGEEITWSLTVGGGRISFSPSTCTLSSGGSCSVGFTGTSVGAATIQASYGGDPRNHPSAKLAGVSIAKTGTSIAISCQSINMSVGWKTTCMATVKGYHENGTVAWSVPQGAGVVTVSDVRCTLSQGSCTVTVYAVKLGTATVKAAYSGDPGNEPSFETIAIQVYKGPGV